MDNHSSKVNTYGNLGIIALNSFRNRGEKINELLLKRYRENVEFDHGDVEPPESFIVPIEEVRFANGEGKVKISETVRGKDIFVMCDIGNYSCTYDLHGFTNHMGPDEHFQDLKRTLSAIGGKSRRTTVILPMLYASRQHKRKSRESLDCAMALQELENMGVKDILTFDVHDSSVQNAIPLVSFENLYATHYIVRTIAEDQQELFKHEKLIIISPDTGAMDRAIYYSNLLGADVGLFYKRRDYTKIIKGKNPIVEHEYMGPSVEGQNILIVDDIIGSGESVFDIVVELKKRKANKIFVATTFALFTEGVNKFNDFYENGIINKVYSTNLTYVQENVKQTKWFKEVDLSEFIARLIDNLNYSRSVAPLYKHQN